MVSSYANIFIGTIWNSYRLFVYDLKKPGSKGIAWFPTSSSQSKKELVPHLNIHTKIKRYSYTLQIHQNKIVYLINQCNTEKVNENCVYLLYWDDATGTQKSKLQLRDQIFLTRLDSERICYVQFSYPIILLIFRACKQDYLPCAQAYDWDKPSEIKYTYTIQDSLHKIVAVHVNNGKNIILVTG